LCFIQVFTLVFGTIPILSLIEKYNTNMPILSFKVNADYEAVSKMRQEIDALRETLRSFPAGTAAETISQYEHRLASLQQQFAAIAREAAQAGGAVEQNMRSTIERLQSNASVKINIDAAGASEMTEALRGMTAALQQSVEVIQSAKRGTRDLSQSISTELATSAQTFLGKLGKPQELSDYFDAIKMLFDEKGKTINQSYLSFVDTAHIVSQEQQNITQLDSFITQIDTQRDKLVSIQNPTQQDTQQYEALSNIIEVLHKERDEREILVQLGQQYCDTYQTSYRKGIELTNELTEAQRKQLDTMRELSMQINTPYQKPIPSEQTVAAPQVKPNQEIVQAVDALVQSSDGSKEKIRAIWEELANIQSEANNASHALDEYVKQLAALRDARLRNKNRTEEDEAEIKAIEERIILADNERQAYDKTAAAIGLQMKKQKEEYAKFDEARQRAIENNSKPKKSAITSVADYTDKDLLPTFIAENMRQVDVYQKQIQSTQQQVDALLKQPADKQDNQALKEKIIQLDEYKRAYASTQQMLNARLKLLATDDGSIEQMRAKLTLLKEAYANMDGVFKNSKFGNEVKQEIDRITQALTQSEREGKAFRTQMRAIQQELMQMRANGQQNTQRYMELTEQAAKMKRTMAATQKEISILGSPGTNFQGMINGLQGVSGAFSAAQGAMGLFADKNEDLQKVMVKLQSVMAITTGLQSLNNTLLSTSAFRVGILGRLSTWWRKCKLEAAAATTLETAALEANTAASAENATAQTASATATAAGAKATAGFATTIKALGVAMRSLSAGWIVAIVAAISAAVYFFATRSSEAEKRVKSLGKALKEQYAEQAKSLVSYQKLQQQWKNLNSDKSNNSEQQRIRWIDLHRDAIKQLGLQVNNLNEAENVFVRNADNVAQAFAARARQKAAEKLYEEEQKKVLEAQADTEKSQKNNSWTWEAFFKGFAPKYWGQTLPEITQDLAAKKQAKAEEASEYYRQEGESAEKTDALNTMKATLNGLEITDITVQQWYKIAEDIRNGLYTMEDLPQYAADKVIMPMQTATEEVRKQFDTIVRSTDNAIQKGVKLRSLMKSFGLELPFAKQQPTAEQQYFDTAFQNIDQWRERASLGWQDIDKLIADTASATELTAVRMRLALGDAGMDATEQEINDLVMTMQQLAAQKPQDVPMLTFLRQNMSDTVTEAQQQLERYFASVNTSTAKYLETAKVLWEDVAKSLPEAKNLSYGDMLTLIKNSDLSAAEKRALTNKIETAKRLIDRLSPSLALNFTEVGLTDIDNQLNHLRQGTIEVSFEPKENEQLDTYLDQLRQGISVPVSFIKTTLDGDNTSSRGSFVPYKDEAAQAEDQGKQKAQEIMKKGKNELTSSDTAELKAYQEKLREKRSNLPTNSDEAIKLYKEMQQIDRKLGNNAADYSAQSARIQLKEQRLQRQRQQQRAEEDAAYNHQKALNDLEKNGEKKRLAELELSHQRRLTEIKRAEDDELEQHIAEQQREYEANEQIKAANARQSGVQYSAVPWQRSMANIGAARKQLGDKYIVRRKDEDASYERQKIEYMGTLGQSMLQFLMQYGTIEQRKTALGKQKDAEVAKAREQGDTAAELTAAARYEEELKKIDEEVRQHSINWRQVFSDLTVMTSEQLGKSKEILKAELQKGNLTVEQYKTITEQIDRIDEQIVANQNKTWKSFGWVNEYSEKVKLLQMRLDDAKAADTIADEQLEAAQTEQKQTTQSITDKLGEAGLDEQTLSEMGLSVNIENADAILRQLKVTQEKANDTLKDEEKIVAEDTPLYKAVTELLEKLSKNDKKVETATENKNSTETKVKNASNALDNLKNDVTEKLGGSLGMVGMITANIQELPGLMEKFGVDMDSGFGKALSGVADAAENVQGAMQDLTQGNFIGALSKAVSAFTSLGDVIFGGANTEYDDLMDKYSAVIDAWDDLLDRKKQYITESWGDEAMAATEEALKLLETNKQVQQELLLARNRYGGSWRSSSIGHKTWKGSGEYGYEGTSWRSEARAIEQLTGASLTGMDDLAKMTSEQLQLVKENYTGLWAHLDEDFREGLEKIIEYGDEYDDLLDQIKEKMTGLTFDSLRSSFISSLMDMSKSTQDFLDDINKQFMQAAMDNILGTMFDDRLQDFYDRYYAAMSDSELTSSEVNELRNQYKAIVSDAMTMRDELAEVTGYEQSSQTTASSKGFTAMSQDSADELNGRFTALQISAEAIRTDAATRTATLAEIDTTALQMLQQQVQQNTRYADMEQKIADCTMTLHQIETNTAAIIAPIREMNDNIERIRVNTSTL
jgi:hypothetical protein